MAEKESLSRRKSRVDAGATETELTQRLADNSEWIAQADKAPVQFPWEDVDHRIPASYNIQFDEPTRLKLEWIARRMPKGSIRKLLLEGIELVIDKRLPPLIKKEVKDAGQ